MFFYIKDDLPNSVLRRKALKIQKLGRSLRLMRIIAQFVCSVCLLYAVINPGYWVNFFVPCAVICKYQL
jgi:hypothetical protein